MRITIRKEGEKRINFSTVVAKTLDTVHTHTHTHKYLLDNLRKIKISNKIKMEELQNFKRKGLRYLSRAPTKPSIF